MFAHRRFPVLVLALVLTAPALAVGGDDPQGAVTFDALPLLARVNAAPTEALHEIVAELTAMPTGPAAPAAWLTWAAREAGALPASLPSLPDWTFSEAFEQFYARHDLAVDANLARAIAQHEQGLTPVQAAALSELVTAIVVASDLVHGAADPADIELIARDPARAMLVNTIVGNAAAGTLPAELVAEHAALTQALARVDRTAMVMAALVVTHAVAEQVPLLESAQVELPFVLIGAPGDSTHTAMYTLLIDESGNDLYLNAAGAGLFGGVGVGIAIDQGAGNDRYTAASAAQGFGLAGVGLLVDEGGADIYKVTSFGHGFGVAGVGILHDQGTGDDQYLTPDPLANIGTKAGALAGIGILVDEGGNDHYRQDGLDGFVYGAANGIGVLADRGDGNDLYESRDTDHTIEPLGFLGNFTGPVQVSAEVGGAAILFEEGGDDVYQCGERVRQGCQGAGGANAVGLLLDRGGNDAYGMGVSFSFDVGALLSEEGFWGEDGSPLGTLDPLPDEGPETGIAIFPMGQGAGYGPSAPGGTGILFDAAGDDAYAAEKWAQGYGTVGLGLLLDEGGGSDTYVGSPPLVGSRGDGESWSDGATGLGMDR